VAADSQIISAITKRFRQKLADETLTLAQVKTYADTALSAIVSGTTVVSVSFEGGGTSAQVNCDPSVLLEACTTIIDEQAEDTTDIGTGATHIDLSQNPVST
jgi:hypothetical protein